MTEQQKAIVRGLKKCGPASGTVVLSIKDEKGVEIGKLVPVDVGAAKNAVIISALTKWRAMFMRYFMTQFTATEERTKKWVEDIILPDDSKILFLIHDETNKPIGNFAVRDISDEAAELDNLIRGEAGGGANLIFFSELNLIDWLFRELKVARLFLRVLSNNPRTLKLHSSAGFREAETFPMRKVVENGEVRYETLAVGEPSNCDFGLVRMEMTKAQFYEQHANFFAWNKLGGRH